jgi:hypothetical protein
MELMDSRGHDICVLVTHFNNVTSIINLKEHTE